MEVIFILKSRLRSTHAFTLVELIVTITIILILASFLIPSGTHYIKFATESTDVASVKSVTCDLSFYCLDNSVVTSVRARVYTDMPPEFETDDGYIKFNAYEDFRLKGNWMRGKIEIRINPLTGSIEYCSETVYFIGGNGLDDETLTFGDLRRK